MTRQLAPCRTQRYQLAAVGLTLLLVACSNGGGTGDATAPTASQISPASGVAIMPGDPIVISFDEPVKAASVVLGGAMAAESDQGVLSKPAAGVNPASEPSGDTLTISPQSSWSYGHGRTLSVDAKDAAGNAIETLSLNFTVVGGMVYVSQAGDDAEDGTKDHPKASIPAAVAEAQGLGLGASLPGAVLVSEGTYNVDSSAAPPTHVVLVEGISIYGGYSTDWLERDADTHVTTIADVSASGGATQTPNRVIEAKSGTNITSETVVEGFTIQGGAGQVSSALHIQFGQSPMVLNNTIHGGAGASASFGIRIDSFSESPVIQDNIIDGGSGGTDSYGVFNSSSSPLIRDNTIHGGQGSFSTGIENLDASSPIIEANLIDGGGADGSNLSTGISNNGVSNASPGLPTIRNNVVLGGSGGNARGIYNEGNISPLIEGNTIDGGSGGALSKAVSVVNTPVFEIRNNLISGGSGGSSTGIAVTGASPEIVNNVIHGGTGALSIGIVNESGSASVIQNNTISGGSGATGSYGIFDADSSPATIENNFVSTSGTGTDYCILETDNGTDTINNNDLFGCDDALYFNSFASLSFGDIADLNNLLNASGNVSIDPVFADPTGGDVHLTASSPTAVTQGGLDLSADFDTDKDGVARTVPWSMGAYEKD